MLAERRILGHLNRSVRLAAARHKAPEIGAADHPPTRAGLRGPELAVRDPPANRDNCDLKLVGDLSRGEILLVSHRRDRGEDSETTEVET